MNSDDKNTDDPQDTSNQIKPAAGSKAGQRAGGLSLYGYEPNTAKLSKIADAIVANLNN